MPTGVYKKAIHLLPCTIPYAFQPKPMHHPFTHYAPFNNLVWCPDNFFAGTRLQCTFHLHIYAMHTLQGDTYMLDLSFSTYYNVAKVQIVCGK